MKRVPQNEIEKILGADFTIDDHDKDEMAIPSYLHGNPLIRWLLWKKFEVIASLCHLHQEMEVLDFGCGTGMFLPELDDTCRKVWAFDPFPQYAQELSKQLSLDITFAKGLADICDKSLDVIVAANVLEHLQHDELMDCLSGFSKKLRPGGKLVVSGPTENLAYKIGRFIAGFSDKADYHQSNIDTLITDIKTCFTLQKVHTLPFALPPYLYKVCAFQL